MRIWKYPLSYSTKQYINIPEGGEVLHFDNQGPYDDLFIWVLVDETKPTTKRCFAVFGTGHNIPYTKDQLKKINTCKVENGQFIWHAYELLGVD